MSIRKRLLTGFAFALLTTPTLAASQAAAPSACEPYAAIPVTVHAVFDEPTFDDSKNLLEIRALTQDPRRSIPQYDSVTLGVTRYEPVFEIKAPMLTEARPDGTFCARAQYLDVSIGYRSVTVYVASEYGKDPCEHEHILTHEMKHVAVNRDVLNDQLPLVKKKFEDWAKLYGLLIVASPTYAQKQMEEKAQALFHDAGAAMMQDNRERQRIVDSPQEYARNNTACNGRVATKARKFMFGLRNGDY